MSDGTTVTVGAPPVLGVDVGGTFTDVVLAASGEVHVRKVLTTPDDPRVGVCRGVEEVLAASGVAAGSVARLVHGTTLATNVILERRGAEVAFVTTRGFGDMLRLGREARVEGDRYDLFFTKSDPPVPANLTFEVDERMEASGRVRTALDVAGAEAVAARVAARRPAAVAICLINSYVDPAHERLLAVACRSALPDAYVAVSSEVWPELREYDRAMTTVLTAYVGPVMSDYLAGLESHLRDLGLRCAVDIMESSGGVMRAGLAARRPVYTLESGGAAGVTAAGFIGRLLGLDEIISFDMGGTTAKTGIVRHGRPDITHDFQVGGKGSFGSIRSGTGFPVKIPVVDLAEIGAGGGSIAWIDPGGSLRVGPRSAGSVPGPACYGRGGTDPTVTDANLVLGYLDPSGLSDGLRLDRSASLEALARSVGEPLGLDTTSSAWAVHDLVNAGMASAIHVVTVQRGIDPRGFALVGFGGAGPLHVARLADTFGIPTTAVPWGAGVASAVGLCTADLTVHHVRSALVAVDEADPSRLAAMFEELEAEGRAELTDPGADPGADDPAEGAARLQVDRSVDVRFRGQAHHLTVPAPAGPFGPEQLAAVARAFRERYRQAYGIDLEAPTQIVALRTRVTRLVDTLTMPEVALTGTADVSAALVGRRPAYFPPAGMVDTPVYDWPSLAPGATLDGPAIVQGSDTTVVVPNGHRVTLDRHRTIVMQRQPR